MRICNSGGRPVAPVTRSRWYDPLCFTCYRILALNYWGVITVQMTRSNDMEISWKSCLTSESNVILPHWLPRHTGCQTKKKYWQFPYFRKMTSQRVEQSQHGHKKNCTSEVLDIFQQKCHHIQYNLSLSDSVTIDQTAHKSTLQIHVWTFILLHEYPLMDVCVFAHLAGLLSLTLLELSENLLSSVPRHLPPSLQLSDDCFSALLQSEVPSASPVWQNWIFLKTNVPPFRQSPPACRTSNKRFRFRFKALLSHAQ